MYWSNCGVGADAVGFEMVGEEVVDFGGCEGKDLNTSICQSLEKRVYPLHLIAQLTCSK